MDSYRKLSSEVYEIDKYVGRSFGDVEFYYDRLKEVKGKVLEPGVGNGRILIPLFQQGLDIEGLELSESMLQFLKKNCEERNIHPKMYQMDMTNFSIDQKYQAIIVPTGSFLLLNHLDQAFDALNCFYNHLDKGGRLIIDIFLPTDYTKGFISKRVFTNEEKDLFTLEETLVEIDQVQQVNTYHNRYEKWRNGQLLDSELEIFPLKWYGIVEFQLILEKVGFEILTISADYNYGQLPTKDSQLITFEGKKL